MNLSPQRTRMIKALLEKPCTSRELMFQVGCQNPPDIVQHLRKNNDLFILTEMIPSTNRDGKNIKIGLYSIPDCERGKAQRLLDGGVTPPNNSDNHLAKQTTDKENYSTTVA